MDWKPLVLEWLATARQQAEVQANRPNGTRYRLNALNKAIESITQNTETISDIEEIAKLPRVGEKTVTLLKQKVKKYCESNSQASLPPSMALPSTGLTDKSTNKAPKTLASELEGQSYPFAPPPPPKRREYIPKYGSAAYHVLITMRINEIEDPTGLGVGQSELTRLMKPRTVGVLEGAVSRPTPAVGMALKTLNHHECVYLQNSRYFLDEVGRDLANRLIHASGDAENIKLLSASNAAASDASASSGHAAARTPSIRTDGTLETSQSDVELAYLIDEWTPSSFRVKLLIDNREVASKNDRNGLVNDLKNLGLDLDVQALSLGDCLWVAEHKLSGRRAVLDWIIERKTLGDLRSSIHDGRYHDQKKRLSKSTVPHVIYLIEYANNLANNEMFKDNRRKFMTAMSQTLVRPNFRLKLTRSQNETVQYIAKLTELLAQKYEKKPLKVVIPQVRQFETSMSLARQQHPHDHLGTDYSAFHEALAKSKMRTVGETFRLMLRTIKGISAEKALAVQKCYPTPAHLRQAYETEPSEQKRREMVFKATQSFPRRQQLRLGLSEAIYEVWGPTNAR